MDDVQRLQQEVDALYQAFHLLLWDYHSRFHKDAGDTSDYLACVHYPCVNFAIDIFPKQR